jgi:hypothetical protein
LSPVVVENCLQNKISSSISFTPGYMSWASLHTSVD